MIASTKGMNLYKHIKALPKTHPVATLTITNCGLAVIADGLGQAVSNMYANPGINFFQSVQSLALDTERMTRFVAYQGAGVPIVYKWYSFLDRKFPISFQKPISADYKYGGNHNRGPSSSDGSQISNGLGYKFHNLYKPVLKRVFVDQVIFAPFGLLVFFTAMALLEGGKAKGVKEKLSETYWKALVTNWKIWPAVQLINFCYIPLFFRLPFTGVMGIFWNTYLSYINSRKPQSSKVICN
ncbi:hypothetical protein DSO57_1021883 [Entomophthora muscae]|uniref:Uncharacterized protein n=1 Tax=Entomophthora muscae TaxID=34485 RepID=A0ACC2SGP0_9FUNG|nr:hypothetical protein DSO57_1021883 [Entomophthora muscae]